MNLSSLNKQHEDMLVRYIKSIQGAVYEATEDDEVNKFLDFNEILENIINYTNAFNKLSKGENKRTEWAYMTPNLMLYATIGFLSGIKNKQNAKLIDKLSDKLFNMTVDFIGETTDILEDIQLKEKIQEEILTFKEHKYEPNN